MKQFEKFATVKSQTAKETLSPIKTTVRKPSEDLKMRPESSPQKTLRMPSLTKSPLTPDWVKKQISTN